MTTKSYTLESILALQAELEDAIDAHIHFLEIGDINLSRLWEEQINIIKDEIEKL